MLNRNSVMIIEWSWIIQSHDMLRCTDFFMHIYEFISYMCFNCSWCILWVLRFMDFLEDISFLGLCINSEPNPNDLVM